MQSSAILSSRGAPTPIFDSIAGRVEQQLARRAAIPLHDSAAIDRGAQFWSPKQTAPPLIERAAAARTPLRSLDERHAVVRADIAKQERAINDVRDANKAQLALEAVQDELLRSRIDAHKRALTAASAGAQARAMRVLTEAEQVRVDEFVNADDDEIVAVVQDIEVKGRDATRLADGGWLNDEVVNAYMAALRVRAGNDERTFFKVHTFSSFFYELLSAKGRGYDYARVRTWSRRFDMFALDKVFIPVHLGNHWCLAIINFAARRFEYYDSFGHDNEPCLSRLRRYVTDEHQDKKKEPLAGLDEWTDLVPKNIPRQTNGYDCGVFMLEFARHAMLRVDNASADSQFPFAQRDMLDIRNRIALELIEADERAK
jgi:Ulp1 family protease